MSIRILNLLMLTIAFNSFAEQKAITNDGHTVILNDDQTWRFEDSKLNNLTKIPTNSKKFFKSNSQTLKVKALPTSFSVYTDPKKWNFSKDKDTQNRLIFNSKISEVYGLIIPEAIEFDIENLGVIAFENMIKADPNAKINRKEYRIVNGKKILFMEMEATMKSIKFKYLGYYSSNKSGSVQLIGYSSANIVDSNLDEIESFLNGFLED
jgi:hypothetical protein